MFNNWNVSLPAINILCVLQQPVRNNKHNEIYFDVCKESARKTVKVKILEALLRISLKKVNNRAAF